MRLPRSVDRSAGSWHLAPLLLPLLLGLACEGVGILTGGRDQGLAPVPSGDLPPRLDARPLPDVASRPAVQDRGGARPTTCTGTHAYLHGDLWPMWYNFRVCCDGEHKAAWRCERINGAGAAACATVASRYQECLKQPNGSVCPNWGVCCFKGSNGCVDPDAEHKAVCTTSSWDYASSAIWGTYLGYQWGSSTDLHRFTTIKVWQGGASDPIIAFSSNPGSGDAYMSGTSNHGVGPEPQGFIQVIKDKFKDRFGAFACIRLPADQPLTLQGFWLNDFAHTCKKEYWSQPDVPCRSEKISRTFKPGRHYLWTERGIEELPGCAGPPPEILKWLPAAACSTAS